MFLTGKKPGLCFQKSFQAGMRLPPQGNGQTMVKCYVWIVNIIYSYMFLMYIMNIYDLHSYNVYSVYMLQPRGMNIKCHSQGVDFNHEIGTSTAQIAAGTLMKSPASKGAHATPQRHAHVSNISKPLRPTEGI